ncbi:MAG: phosphomannose isomerase type II C-terminal cupin domain [Candidatus Harrisonbacteria bacterium]|nr:phosphomannose isomerase type II C-terminal cupin domain [Candidatus Harrisonbacteria bacterium]
MDFAPFTEERPWGGFRQLSQNSPSTVKILTIRSGEAFSLQYHERRSEFWLVLSGHPRITLGEEIIDANPGDEFSIEAKTKHRIEGVSDEVKVLEISFGEFDEKDIVRLDDKYGRN